MIVCCKQLSTVHTDKVVSIGQHQYIVLLMEERFCDILYFTTVILQTCKVVHGNYSDNHCNQSDSHCNQSESH